MLQFAQINDISRILSHPTWDIIMVFTMLAAGFFYGIFAGKLKIAATIIYTYVAWAITSALPLFDKPLNGTRNVVSQVAGESPLNEFFIRAAIFIGIFLIITFSLGSRRNRRFASPGSWWQIFLLSFLQVGLLLHLILNFLPADKINMLAPLTRTVFANPKLHIWWLIIPMAILIILRRFEPRDD